MLHKFLKHTFMLLDMLVSWTKKGFKNIRNNSITKKSSDTNMSNDMNMYVLRVLLHLPHCHKNGRINFVT